MNVETPATVNVFVLTSAVVIPLPPPDAVTPVNAEPSPENLSAVRRPVLGLYVNPVSVSAPCVPVAPSTNTG